MKLILNADDFGYDKGINFGVIEAYQKGLLTSTTLMTNMPGAEHAGELKKENPGLGVGLHLNFSLKRPLTDGKTLVKEDGEMIKPDLLPADHIYDPVEVRKELEAQFNRFVELTGSLPTHMDSHLFSTEKVEVIRKEAVKFASEKNLPFRNHDINNFQHVEFINHRNYNTTPDLEYIIRNFDDISKNPFVEIMTHPGYIDQYLLDNSSYNVQRAKELQFLCDPEIRKFMESRGVAFISYETIARG